VLSRSELVRIDVCLAPTDMRKSFDSLAALVQDWLGHDPLTGPLFVFRSRRGDRVKLLWWDRDGWTLYYRRLEEGTFRFPTSSDPQARSIEVSAQELSLVLWGIDPAVLKQLVVQLLEELRSANARLERQEHHMHLLLKRLYGSTSEQFDPRQSVLFAAGPLPGTPELAFLRERPRRSRGRDPFQPAGLLQTSRP
jgi:transposase